MFYFCLNPQRFPVMWQGGLALKNESSYVQMHFIAGNRRLPSQALPQPLPNGVLPPLRISQRMRLEHSQLDGVAKRMQVRTLPFLRLYETGALPARWSSQAHAGENFALPKVV